MLAFPRFDPASEGERNLTARIKAGHESRCAPSAGWRSPWCESASGRRHGRSSDAGSPFQVHHSRKPRRCHARRSRLIRAPSATLSRGAADPDAPIDRRESQPPVVRCSTCSLVGGTVLICTGCPFAPWAPKGKLIHTSIESTRGLVLSPSLPINSTRCRMREDGRRVRPVCFSRHPSCSFVTRGQVRGLFLWALLQASPQSPDDFLPAGGFPETRGKLEQWRTSMASNGCPFHE